MISFQKKEFDDETVKKTLNPLVKKWFFNNFKNFAPPQKFSIPNIHNNVNTLISSPTGSGKTLSAFLSIISELTNLSEQNKLEDKVYCIYISPLKALSNDIEKNLTFPLKGVKELNKNINIRVAVRTGDTSSYEKSKMLKKPPHIIITTPESFSIMLASKKFVDLLKTTKWLIVDEIHSLAGNKRGSHLSLSLEILNKYSDFVRIGLSATVSPLEEVANFLVGFDNNKARDCKIVDVNYLKKLDLKVLSPVKDIINSDFGKIQDETYRILNDLINNHKTTLIFTNTRSATERVVHNLKERFPKSYTEDSSKPGNLISAHHSSLSKSSRLRTENLLKEGKLKTVVSSTSLELGIDIGNIDLVILLGSPKSVARTLQRIGRAGHNLHEVSKGRILIMDRDDLVECSVLLKAALERKIDKISIPKNALDVLSQQILGISLHERISREELLGLVRKSYSFNSIDTEVFDEVLSYLAGEFSSLEDRNVYAKIWLDDTIAPRGKLARVLYMTNIGTIPDEASVRVKIKRLGKLEVIGKIDEGFLERLKPGDVFVLGGESYEFRYSRGMSAFVNTALGKPPTIPSWFSEMLPLSFDLSLEIQKFRRLMEEQFLNNHSKEEIIDFIHSYLYIDKFAGNSIYEYFKEQFNFSRIPHDKNLLIEHYTDDERNSKYIIFHSLYGRRVNDVLSRAVGYAISKIQKRDVEIGLNDNGFYIRTFQKIQAERAFSLLKSSELRNIMEQALLKTEILNRRFRHCATRALMILRSYKGRRKTVGRQQLSSRLLINKVREISEDFPILKETKREILEDFMDIDNAILVLEDIESGKLKISEFHTQIPSPFSFNLILEGYSDIMKMEDRKEFLKRLHTMVLAKISLKKEF